MGTPPPDVVVDFPFTEPHEPLLAQVTTDGWFPTTTDGTGDIAVLEVSGRLPPSARPAPLRVSDGVTGHRFRATGFPAGHHGPVISTGVVVGPAEAQWLQLQAESTLGFSLEAGFSGAPLWDEDVAAVVGIVVGRERPRGALGDPRTGYAIPVDVAQHYWPALRPWVGWRLDHDPDLRAHWDPRARGVPRQSLPGWNFTGRTAAITRLVSWLGGSPPDEPIHVVTGGPGSGKSSVLARLVTMADPQIRALIAAEDPGQLADPVMVPPLGAISLALRCSGLDLSGVCQALTRFQQPTSDSDTAIGEVVQRGEPMVLVVDALDEAVNENEARTIAVRLLRPLAEAGASIGVKVLVGTRRGHNDSLLRALGPAARTDLDDPEFLDAADISSYAEHLLLAGSYRDAPAAAREIAGVIARRSQPSFLVAGLTARTWASRHAVDVSGSGWEHRQNFPVDVDEAMREYLERLPDPDRALSLLRIVAHGRHPGLPMDVWEAAAAAYLPTVSRAEIDGLLRTAASYLVEQRTIDGEPAVQLFHQALVDHLVAMDTSGLIERTIADVLVADTRACGGWLHAQEYARQHAVSHAAVAGGQLLEKLVTDPEFLVVAERGAVLRALLAAHGQRVKAVAAVYRAVAHALSGSAPDNAAHLELAARRAGEHELVKRIRLLALAQPFETRVVAPVSRPAGQLTLTGQNSAITALTAGVLLGRPVLVSGAQDGTVAFWDPTDGSLLDSFDGDGEVSALGWVELDGATWLAATRTDDTVTLWDLIRRPGSPHVVRLAEQGADWPALPVWQDAIDTWPHTPEGLSWRRIATGWGRLNGTPVLLHGFEDGSVLAWRVEDGAPVLSLWPHVWGGSADWGEIDDRPVLVTAGNNEIAESANDDRARDRPTRWIVGQDGTLIGPGRNATVRFWDPERRVELFQHTMDDVLVTACVLTPPGGPAMLAMACDDGRVHVVDATAEGTELAAFAGEAPLAWGLADGLTVLACVGGGHTVQVWDPRSAARLHTFTSNDAVSVLAWGELDDSAILACAGQNGRIQLWSMPDLAGAADQPPSPVHALSWIESNGRTLLAAGHADGHVEVVDAADSASTMTFVAHDRTVVRVAWGEPDGGLALATSTYEGDVAIWNPTTGRQLLALPHHEEYLRLLSWMRVDERDVLATASQATDLRLWRLDGTSTTPHVRRIGKPVRYLMPGWTDESAIVIGGIGDQVVVYDPVTWEVRHSWDEGSRPADRAPETCLTTAFLNGAPITVRGGKDGRLVFWYPRPGHSMFDALNGHDGPVLAMAWGKSEATAARLASGGADGQVLVWDVSDPAEPAVLHTIDAGGPVNAVAWNRFGDEDMLTVGTTSAEVRLYWADGGELAGGVEGLGGPVTAVTTAPEDPNQVTAIGTAEGDLWLLFLTDDGEHVIYQLPLPGAVSALAWSYWPEGAPVLAIGSTDGSILLWDPRTALGEDGMWIVDHPDTIRELAPATGVPISALTWGPDGPPTLVGGASDGTVRTWEIALGAETHAFQTDQHMDTALATGQLNGRAVIAAAGSQLRVWDITTGTPVVITDAYGTSTHELVFGEIDNRTVMAQHDHDGVHVWDPSQAAPQQTIVDIQQPRPGALRGVGRLSGATVVLPVGLTRLSREAMEIATGLAPPVVALGKLNGDATLVTGTKTGLITLTNLRDDTQRTINWYHAVHALAIGPDNLIAIGDPQGYTVIQVG